MTQITPHTHDEDALPEPARLMLGFDRMAAGFYPSDVIQAHQSALFLLLLRENRTQEEIAGAIAGSFAAVRDMAREHFLRTTYERPIVAAVPVPTAVRPEVAAFALLMERELQANEHKGGWQNDNCGALARRTVEEAGKLQAAADAILNQTIRNLDAARAAVAREAADTANMAMMTADVVLAGGVCGTSSKGSAS